MNEASFCTAITNKFMEEKAFAYKIPDPTKEEIRRGARKRPFDIVAWKGDISFALEAKFMKGYFAFNFDRIEEHQFWWLDCAKRAFELEPRKTFFCGIIVAFWEPRKLYDVFVFDIDYLKARMSTGEKSIKQKELLDFKERKLCFPLKELTPAKILESAIYGT